MKINKELKERLRKLAELDGRNLSNLIQKVLSDYAAQKEGFLTFANDRLEQVDE